MSTFDTTLISAATKDLVARGDRFLQRQGEKIKAQLRGSPVVENPPMTGQTANPTIATIFLVEWLALKEESARFRAALEAINRRASPGRDRTLDECASDLYWCASEARRVLNGQ